MPCDSAKRRGQDNMLQPTSCSAARLVQYQPDLARRPFRRRPELVRIVGVDVPDRKRAHVALRSIYGIGPKMAAEILVKLDIDPESAPRMNELTEAQVDRIREIVAQEYLSEGDLRREIGQNIRRLIEIGAYRGLRPPLPFGTGLNCKTTRTRRLRLRTRHTRQQRFQPTHGGRV